MVSRPGLPHGSRRPLRAKVDKILRHLEFPTAPPPIAPAFAAELCFDLCPNLCRGDEYAQPEPDEALSQDHPYPAGPDSPDDSDDSDD